MMAYLIMQALVVGLKLTTETHTPKAYGSPAGAFGASRSGFTPTVPGPESPSDKHQKDSGDKQLSSPRRPNATGPPGRGACALGSDLESSGRVTGRGPTRRPVTDLWAPLAGGTGRRTGSDLWGLVLNLRCIEVIKSEWISRRRATLRAAAESDR